MGADDNVDLAKAWFARTAEGDPAIDFWHPDCVIENAEGWVIETSYRGREGAQQWWDEIAEAVTDLRLRLDDAVVVDDDRVLTTQRFTGNFRSTGIDLDGPWASILTFKDGLAIHAVGFLSEAQARRAAGLEVEAN